LTASEAKTSNSEEGFCLNETNQCGTSNRYFAQTFTRCRGSTLLSGIPTSKNFWKRVAAAKTRSEMEKVVQSALGPSGFMEFARFDHGGVVHKGKPGDSGGVLRLVIGNPLIMREMVKHVPDAG